ncbi:hypothetical protein KBP30_01155 [Streptomyces sp. Go40/10]|uniref:hypothetical protein n=1 Tax=Streptomyces sp. Go40/10 TaxID=2825844 RepID=UPI001E2E493E|nr:hypothetical protein [Streptomyces sp. Go40/10]UFQ99910.1 hypothetical protein KBP30_01155 [Streptomyces sp. Go40/10]
MKLLRLAAAAVLLAPLPFLRVTEPAAAAQVHTVVAKGFMEVYECCSILSPSHTKIVPIDERVVLTHGRPNEHFWVRGCAGDQVRGELRVDLRLNEAEHVNVVARLRLYEETTCENLDRDGEYSPSENVDEGQSRRLDFYVRNAEFHSSDKVTVGLTVSNNAGAPPEPSHVVAHRLPGRSGTIVVDWIDEATNETGYEVRDTGTGQIARLGPNRTETVFNQPIVNRTCFQVRAVGASGASEWTPVSPTAECV